MQRAFQAIAMVTSPSNRNPYMPLSGVLLQSVSEEEEVDSYVMAQEGFHQCHSSECPTTKCVPTEVGDDYVMVM